MDPYLEKYWHEAHQRLVIYTGDALRSLLPPPLKARIGERVILEQEPGDYRSIHPDVHVVLHPRPAPAAAESPAAVTLEEDPLRITPRVETRTEGYIEIVDAASGNRVVTVMEYLSPANKLPGDDRVKYRLKQRDVIRAGANLVEIDLTRTGQRVLALREAGVPLSHRTTYRICVWRSEPEGVFELYRVPLLGPLPSIQVPLRAADSDIALDLQPLVDRCFDMGNYDDIDYRADPDPPLEADDAKLADDWLRSKALR
jgi:hypothetical protein